MLHIGSTPCDDAATEIRHTEGPRRDARLFQFPFTLASFHGGSKCLSALPLV
jgi:hypothetical protein